MGKVNQNPFKDLTLTSLQRFVFDEFSKEKRLTKQFYLTRGTALSSAYLQHRESEDLDFFSETDFDKDMVDKFIQAVSRIQGFQIRLTQIKIDFAFYPYKRLKKGLIISGVKIDSLFDIATNKLQTITSRTEVKDFVDLYFLLKKFTLWDLMYAVKEKFEDLPKMLAPFSLKDMQDFYKEKAKELGKSVTKQ